MRDVLPAIQTGRLLLRPWREEDVEPFAAMNADARVMEHFPKMMTREESEGTVRWIGKHFERHGFGLWAVEVAGGARFIGFIGLAVPSFVAHFTPCVEIGWRLARAHWGMGYATEGAMGAMGFGFGKVGLREIVSFTAVGNVRSRRVMEKLGMRRREEEDFDHPALAEGHRLRRHVLYRMGKGEWERWRGDAACSG